MGDVEVSKVDRARTLFRQSTLSPTYFTGIRVKWTLMSVKTVTEFLFPFLGKVIVFFPPKGRGERRSLNKLSHCHRG